MFDHDEDSGEVPLLTAYPLLQRLIMGSYKKKQFLHTKSQIVLMLALNSHEALTMTQIARFISSSNEQATRAVAPLAEEGYIQRSIDIHNRTHVLVKLTEKGKEYISRKVDELREDLNARLKNSLTEDERGELKDAVVTLIRLMEKVE